MKAKIISGGTKYNIERELNIFLQSLDQVQIISVKMSSCQYTIGGQIITVLIIYK